MGTMTTPMSPLKMNYRVVQNILYSHHTDVLKDSDGFDKLHYIYQHFQDS